MNIIDLVDCDVCRNVFDPIANDHDLVTDKYGRNYRVCGTCLHGHTELQMLKLVNRGD